MQKLILVVLLLMTASGVSPAQAHAYLDHANPAVDSTVQTAPPELTLWFTQKLEPAFSSVEVTGPDGASVSAGKAQVSGNIMRVSIKAAGPGAYQVHWQATSVDTHKTQGSFTFHVGGS
jgi:copper resistance protein C